MEMHPMKKTLRVQRTVGLRLRRDYSIDELQSNTYSQENQSNQNPCDTENYQTFSNTQATDLLFRENCELFCTVGKERQVLLTVYGFMPFLVNSREGVLSFKDIQEMAVFSFLILCWLRQRLWAKTSRHNSVGLQTFSPHMFQ